MATAQGYMRRALARLDTGTGAAPVLRRHFGAQGTEQNRARIVESLRLIASELDFTRHSWICRLRGSAEQGCRDPRVGGRTAPGYPGIVLCTESAAPHVPDWNTILHEIVHASGIGTLAVHENGTRTERYLGESSYPPADALHNADSYAELVRELGEPPVLPLPATPWMLRLQGGGAFGGSRAQPALAARLEFSPLGAGLRIVDFITGTTFLWLPRTGVQPAGGGPARDVPDRFYAGGEAGLRLHTRTQPAAYFDLTAGAGALWPGSTATPDFAITARIGAGLRLGPPAGGLVLGVDFQPILDLADQARGGWVLVGGVGWHWGGPAERVQRKAAGDCGSGTAPAIVEAALRSPGQPLDLRTRGFMESRFGRDFQGVRVHTGPLAAASARALSARAYTAAGRELVFAPGEYAPGTAAGRQLIAHELTHVIQQAGTGCRSVPAVQRWPFDRDRDPIHAPIIEEFRQRHGLGPEERGPGFPSEGEIQHQLSGPAQLGSLSGMTPWELGQVPEGRLSLEAAGAPPMLGPGFEDYARACRLVLCVLDHVRSRLGRVIDPDTPGPLGRLPQPSEWPLLNRTLARLLAHRSVGPLVRGPGGRAAGASSGPGLTGRVRIAGGADWAAKRYQLEQLISTPSSALDSRVQQWWAEPSCRIQPGTSPQVTRQERLIVHFFELAGGGTNGGFYFPPEDTIYLGDQLVADLTGRDPALRRDAELTAGHEMVHFLGGRMTTLRAFQSYFRNDQWICYWRAFEEGMAEIVTEDSLNAGQAAPSREYASFVRVMRGIMADLGSERVRRTFFTGAPDREIFELLRQRVPATTSWRDHAPVCRPLFPSPAQPQPVP